MNPIQMDDDMAPQPEMSDDDAEPEEEPVAKEMFDATYDRVDVVAGPASGMRFAVLKAGQAQPQDAVEAVRKAEKSTASMNDAPDSDFAYIEPGGKKDDEGKTTPRSKRHFYIGDASHVRNALARASQSPFGDKAMPKIRAAAKKFGIDVSKSQEDDTEMTDELRIVSKSEDEQVPAEPVAKADDEQDLDASEVLADAEGSPAGLEEEPGSPAWEAVDSATARKWTALLGRAKNALETLASREAMEVAAGEEEDVDQAFDLDDAACAIDYAIGVLAKFAVDEQGESDEASEEYGLVAKALSGAEGFEAALDTLEGLAPVKKAGRVLSSANEGLIRDASENLQKVLASLPAAPEAVTKAQEEPSMTTETEPAVEPVEKAKGDPMVPVYDANGNLCGMVEAKDIVPIAKAPDAADEQDASEAPDEAEAGADDAMAADTEAAAAPAAQAPGSAAPVAAPHEADQSAVAKSEFGQEPEVIEDAKSSVIKALEGEVNSLKERIATLESQPMPGGPRLRGLSLGDLVETSGGHVALRGQATVNSPEIERVRKQLEETQDPVEQAALSRELSLLAMRQRLGG